jgi:hypothetical protein
MAKGKNESGIPQGFTAIKSGGFAPIHDWKKNPLLRGIVQAVRTSDQKRGGKIVPVKILEVADSETGEMTSVWESYALAGLLEAAKVGDEVFIRFEGVKKLKGKKTLKEFTCGIQEKKGRK